MARPRLESSEEDPEQTIINNPSSEDGDALSTSEDGDEPINNDGDAGPSTTNRSRGGRPPKYPMGHTGTRGRPRKHPVSQPRAPPPPERRRAPKQKYVAPPSSRQTRTATNTAPPLAMGPSYRLRRPRKSDGAADKPNRVPGRRRGRPRKSDDTADRPDRAAGMGGSRGGGGRLPAKSGSRPRSPAPDPGSSLRR
ncbi:hypothetical protein DL765_004172 [Monosporascus sp. GIB2]|nr:hypothetical protein DL765_004172 [Monosporascus sp. GIB2]